MRTHSRLAGITVLAFAVLLALVPGVGRADGGDFSIDLAAAEPTTYDHDTGVGGAFGDGDIGDDVVESLEGGDFACGERVVFFAKIDVDSGATGSQDIELDFSWLAEPTGQPGVGFVDLLSAGVNSGDSANNDLDGDEDVTILSESLDTGGSNDQIEATIEVTNLDADESLVLRMVVELGCEVGEEPTGNLQAALDAGRVVDPDEDDISVGNQTVPLKSVSDVALPAISVTKECSESAGIGEEVTYTITIENTGNEDLENITVDDSVLGDLSSSFANTLEPGDSESHEFTHTVTAEDDDPLVNEVTVTATGANSGLEVSAEASCETNVTHEPAIKVTKECSGSAAIGGQVTYTITIENMGDEPLENVAVDDSLLGDLSDSYADTLGVGESESHEFTHTVTAEDPDPLPNTVTVTAVGADSEQEVEAEASCETNVTHEPVIEVTKECTGPVAVGEQVTYKITVENLGDEPLENVTVVDSLLGDLSDSYADTLGVGESESHEFTHTVTAQDPDPLPNTVTATGVGADSEEEVTDQASCSSDIVHPAIEIVKTAAPTTVSPGETVTYSYAVTNTGDVTLFEVSVDDDVLGHIGDIAELAVDETVTLTTDVVIAADSPTVNVGTATGHDEEGREVSDDDDADIAIVLAEQEERTLPKTGIPLDPMAAFGSTLLGIGLSLRLATRKPRRRNG